MSFDFFAEYTRIHHEVYGRDPCTREQWERWCAQPKPLVDWVAPMTDVQFDYNKELEGDAQ